MKSDKGRILRYIVWGAFTLVMVTPVFLMGILRNPDDEQRLIALKQIAAESSVYPGSVKLNSSEDVKTNRASLLLHYRVPAQTPSFEQVKAFYLRELVAKGWEPNVKRRNGPLFGSDDYRPHVTFRKGPYEVTVEPESEYQGEYIVSYSWERP